MGPVLQKIESRVPKLALAAHRSRTKRLLAELRRHFTRLFQTAARLRSSAVLRDVESFDKDDLKSIPSAQVLGFRFFAVARSLVEALTPETLRRCKGRFRLIKTVSTENGLKMTENGPELTENELKFTENGQKSTENDQNAKYCESGKKTSEFYAEHARKRLPSREGFKPASRERVASPRQRQMRKKAVEIERERFKEVVALLKKFQFDQNGDRGVNVIDFLFFV